MARTQKEISKRYEGNRSYLKILHYFRRWKLQVILGTVAFGLAFVALFTLGLKHLPHLEKFYNVGGISQSHAQIAQDCNACHVPSTQRNLMPMVTSNESLEVGCQTCHTNSTFHHANVVTKTTCISCHHEHLGVGPMQPATDSSCISCHGNASVMEASRAKVLTLPSSFLEIPPARGVLFYPSPRMPDGYTKVIHAFDQDHPAFRIETEKMSDATAEEMNRLKFSHKIHLGAHFPQVDGKKLDCNYCHKLDATKTYMQPVTYEVNCKACHSLQFDTSLPDLNIPHPTDNSDSVRNFLLTLPTQIETYARENLHMTDKNRVKDFVSEKMLALRERARRGDDLIHDVFFADNQRSTSGGTAEEKTAAAYPGCAYCHSVLSSASGAPVIAKPLVPDRWFSHANFNHAKHATVSCDQCHGPIRQSTLTSEIALPTKASCVTCHSDKGQVVNTCVTCHNYHHTPPPGLENAMFSPVRQMLIGER